MTSLLKRLRDTPPLMKRTVFILFSFWVLAAALVACSSPSILPSPAANPTASLQALPPPTSTPAPTPTSSPELAVLIPDPAHPEWTEPVLAALQEFTAPAGLTLETTPRLDPAQLPSRLRLVVSLVSLPDLLALLAAAPQAQFLVVTDQPLDPAANLSVLHLNPEAQMFVAGLASTLLSDDWRAAGLIPAETPTLQEAFVNGGRYFCGECAPGWPLGFNFPLAGGPQAAQDGPAWQAVAASFFDQGKVDVFFLSPEATRPEVLAYLNGLAQLNTPVRLVGILPPPPEIQSQWALSVSFDLPSALRQALPELLGGKSAGQLTAPIDLTHINPDLFTPGRERLVRTIMQLVISGQISPLSVPVE
uniref:BMP family ABC transporter substrate-binding protein n=1 Tax=Anaerolinea thermolimosa TaxID=229919 RepID=A0A7C4KK02_9CHLR